MFVYDFIDHGQVGDGDDAMMLTNAANTTHVTCWHSIHSIHDAGWITDDHCLEEWASNF